MEIRPTAELIDYTPDPIKNVAIAARLCYSKDGARDLEKKMSRQDMEKLVKKVVELGHHSTLEHTYFYFHIECSRVTSHQLVRQRIGTSYSQRSQRYVEEDNFSYITPPSIMAKPALQKKYKEWMQKGQEFYQELLNNNIPAEDARFVLPTVKTNLVVSFNARSLYHFFSLRCCTRAQWEIRSIARQMLKQVKKIAPVLFENAGAPCEVSGECPEGKLSCGKVVKLKNGGN